MKSDRDWATRYRYYRRFYPHLFCQTYENLLRLFLFLKSQNSAVRYHHHLVCNFSQKPSLQLHYLMLKCNQYICKHSFLKMALATYNFLGWVKFHHSLCYWLQFQEQIKVNHFLYKYYWQSHRTSSQPNYSV